MAQNNLAENLIDVPSKRTISVPNKPKTVAAPVATPRLKVNNFEKLLIVACTLVVALLMVLVVNSKIALTNSEHQLQQLQTTSSKISTENTNLDQQISELQSSTRLEAIAQKDSMSLSNSRIRNVTK
ncbi:cell division protein FtsL [Lentilactobacillus senioris]|uniref:cell division protein FtsL n=1 Tax=Lentilactobacillus senioris TaxID=931534 RepID=UPI003D2CEFB8